MPKSQLGLIEPYADEALLRMINSLLVNLTFKIFWLNSHNGKDEKLFPRIIIGFYYSINPVYNSLRYYIDPGLDVYLVPGLDIREKRICVQT